MPEEFEFVEEAVVDTKEEPVTASAEEVNVAADEEEEEEDDECDGEREGESV